MKIPILTGLPCIITRRAADLRGFHFGRMIRSREKRGVVYRGEMILHVQSFWRIVKGDQVVVSRSDLWEPTAKNPWRHGWSYDDGNLQDEKLRTLFPRRKTDGSLYARDLLVTGCRLARNLDLQVRFDTGHVLQVFNAGVGESMRFIPWPDGAHVVIGDDD